MDPIHSSDMVEDQHMIEGDTLDVTSAAFARRLANLLAQRRRETGASLRHLSRVSGRAYSRRDLRQLESGRHRLDQGTVGAAALLYQADLDSILPTRLPLEIRPSGELATSGLTARFVPDDATSLLSSYLRLIRQLRLQQSEPMIELRREDVEVIAEFLGESATAVIERLGALMGATQIQRRAMAGMFLAGAVVIGLAGGSVAALGSHGSGAGSPGTAPAARVATTTTTTTTDTTTDRGEQEDATQPVTAQATTTTTTVSATTFGANPSTTVIAVAIEAPAKPDASDPLDFTSAPTAPQAVTLATRPTTAGSPDGSPTPTSVPTPVPVAVDADSVIFGGPAAPTQADPIVTPASEPDLVAIDTPPAAPDTPIDDTLAEPADQATDLPPVPGVP